MTVGPEVLAAQFADLDAATGRHGTVGRTVLLAGRAVRFEAGDRELLDLVCEPMRHLPTSVDEPAATLRVVRRQDVSEAVTWRFDWERPRYVSDRHTFTAMSWMEVLVAEDRLARRTLVVTDGEDAQRFRRPETTRPFLESMLSGFGLVGVHGGTVGDERRCVLLTGRGGSGKSSLVAQAVARGYSTVGDDFLYLGAGADRALHSAYATVKLAPSSPASGMLDPAIAVVDGKRLGWLPDLRPGCVVARQEPVAIVVPTVGDAVRLRPVDHRTALTALLPSSVAMSSDRATATRVLTDLVRTMPCFGLTVAQDADAALGALAELVESGGLR